MKVEMFFNAEKPKKKEIKRQKNPLWKIYKKGKIMSFHLFHLKLFKLKITDIFILTHCFMHTKQSVHIYNMQVSLIGFE